MIRNERHDAYEILAPRDGSRVLMTVEHASNRLPAPWSWGEDAWLQDTHWAWDPGAETLARELADALGAAAVIARFTRLLVDPNRALSHDVLFRDRADGRPVGLNLEVTDRQTRVEDWYAPYHDALDRTAAAMRPGLILGVHCFTPVYEGVAREVEIGVLHVDQPDMAAAWADAIAGHGYEVRINEPYSGGKGFMYSPQHHAERAGCPALELEIRHDYCTDPDHRARIRPLIEAALNSYSISPSSTDA